MKAIGGSGFALWDDKLLHRTYMAMARTALPGEDDRQVDRRNAGIAGLALRAFAPTDEIEAMIAAQTVALHAMSMECARRAMIREQNPDIASKLRKDACNASRAMIEMTEALQRRRGKGSQVIKVERVMVAPGGQAAVGNFQTGHLPPESIQEAKDPVLLPTASIGEGSKS